MASTTTGSSNGVRDDVTAFRGSRARRPRIYDWNTKQHFYPDIIDSGEWTRQFVRWNSARWRSSGRHQTAGASSSSSTVQQTVAPPTGVVGDHQDRRSTVVLATPFRRSQFVSLSWSEKRGRHGRTPRRARRRLSDPYHDQDMDVDADDSRATASLKMLSDASTFCRSDWKRQVGTSRSKDSSGSDVEHRSTGSRWALLKQITSTERARRRREFVRQRCRRFGWEPFSGEETHATTLTTGTSEQTDSKCDDNDTRQTLHTPAGSQSRDSLPEIVIDHERPAPDGSTAADEGAAAKTVVERQTSTQTTEEVEVSSPSNEYDYVLHRLHQQQRQHQRPSQTDVSQTSQGVSQAPVVTESYQRQAFSLSYGQKMADTDKSRGKSSSVSGTIVELLDRPTTSVKNELRHPQLDRDTQNAFDAVRLSTQVSNKFTDNFQHDHQFLEYTVTEPSLPRGSNESSAAEQSFNCRRLVDDASDVLYLTKTVWTTETIAEAARSRYTSYDDPESRSRQSPSSRRRDALGVILRSPAVHDEMKENVEPTLCRESMHKQPSQRLPASTVFTVTGCPRTAEHTARYAVPDTDVARQSTWSLDRRRPIVVLPDVEQAIEIDNLRRYWYVSERSVLSQQFHRPPPQPPPGRPSPTPSTLRQLTTPQRSKSCEFRREYELAEDRQSAAVVQLQSSRQDDVSDGRKATSAVKTWTYRQNGVPPGMIHAWLNQSDDEGRLPSRHQGYNGESSQIMQPETNRNWSEVQKESTAVVRTVPLDTGLSSTEHKVPSASFNELQSTSPQTVCHVRVTVRHKSPRRGQLGTSNSVQTDSRELTPVPALRRAGTPSKRSSPARRRVTFSELPPAVDERRPMFAAPRYQHNTAGQAAVDTLWNYHETYPRDMGQTLDVQQAAVRLSSPETPRNENGNENTQLPHDLVESRVDILSTCEQSGDMTHDDDDGDDDDKQQQQQQGSVVDEVDQSDDASLSIKQLVASFESMTSPYMRAPLIAKHSK